MNSEPSRRSELRQDEDTRVVGQAATRKAYTKPAFKKFDLVTFTHGALALISPDGACFFS